MRCRLSKVKIEDLVHSMASTSQACTQTFGHINFAFQLVLIELTCLVLEFAHAFNIALAAA